METKQLEQTTLDEMFQHYVERKRFCQDNESGSQDGLWAAGECREAEKWLSLFGVDVSYEHVQPIVDGKAPLKLRFVKEKRKNEQETTEYEKRHVVSVGGEQAIFAMEDTADTLLKGGETRTMNDTIYINGKYGANIGNIQVFTRERAVEVFQLFVKRCYNNLTMESSAVLSGVADDMHKIGFTYEQLEEIEINTIADNNDILERMRKSELTGDLNLSKVQRELVQSGIEAKQDETENGVRETGKRRGKGRRGR